MGRAPSRMGRPSSRRWLSCRRGPSATAWSDWSPTIFTRISAATGRGLEPRAPRAGPVRSARPAPGVAARRIRRRPGTISLRPGGLPPPTTVTSSLADTPWTGRETHGEGGHEKEHHGQPARRWATRRRPGSPGRPGNEPPRASRLQSDRAPRGSGRFRDGRGAASRVAKVPGGRANHGRWPARPQGLTVVAPRRCRIMGHAASPSRPLPAPTVSATSGSSRRKHPHPAGGRGGVRAAGAALLGRQGLLVPAPPLPEGVPPREGAVPAHARRHRLQVRGDVRVSRPHRA